MRMISAMLGATALLAACSSDPHLMSVRSDTPDEFSVVPSKPLNMPPDLNMLPAPTPGGGNLTDPTPDADAVAALGGNPGQLAAQGIGAADGALINYASRNGRQADIRAQLAQEDVEWRSHHSRRLLETLARTNVYMRAYKPMMLDSGAELQRWRHAGAQTPSAPPAPPPEPGPIRLGGRK